MTTPVLDAIREITKFKPTTIPEISSWARIPKMEVLRVVNANKQYMKMSKKVSGRILGVDVLTPLRDQLWNGGGFYRKGSYGAWAPEGDCIELHASRKEEFRHIERKHWTGGLGDSYEVSVIDFTPENVAAVEAAGIRPWEEAVIDDRLWKE